MHCGRRPDQSMNIWINRKKIYCCFVNSKKMRTSIQSDSFYCNHVQYHFFVFKERNHFLLYNTKTFKITYFRLTEKEYFTLLVKIDLSEQLRCIQMRNTWCSGCPDACPLQSATGQKKIKKQDIWQSPRKSS